MGKITLVISPLSPLLMVGANPREPELRSASFRGSFRYWLRAILGDGHEDPEALERLARQESGYFGSTASETNDRNEFTGWKSGSPLRLQVSGELSEGETRKDTVLPPRIAYRSAEPSEVELQFTTHPLRSLGKLCNEPFWAMLLLAFKFGGFGKRSRRGGGNMQVDQVNIDGADLTPEANRGAQLLQYQASTRADLVKHLQETAKYIGAVQNHAVMQAPPSLPAYTIFHPEHTQVYLSKASHDHFLDSLEDDFWNPTGQHHHSGGAWGQVNSRRSSALHVRVQRVAQETYTLVTIFHSAPGTTQDWATLRNVSTILNRNCDFIYGKVGGW